MAEKYSGTKFKTIFLEKKLFLKVSTRNQKISRASKNFEFFDVSKNEGKPSKKKPALEKFRKLIEWCRVFEKNSLAPSYGKGSSGNLSFRSKNGFVITSTASFFSKLLPEDLIEVMDFDLKKSIAFVCGKKIPSSETPMHFLLYKKFPKINAVFHFHDGKLLEKAKELKIPCTKKVIAYGSIASAKAVAKVLKKSGFCCIKEHGFVAIGKTLNETGKLSLKLHKLL